MIVTPTIALKTNCNELTGTGSNLL